MKSSEIIALYAAMNGLDVKRDTIELSVRKRGANYHEAVVKVPGNLPCLARVDGGDTARLARKALGESLRAEAEKRYRALAPYFETRNPAKG